MALSVLNQRRIANFKANQRGYWSLWIFAILFFISLFAEFIANDRPLVIFHDDKTYFPIFSDYQESDFGAPYPLLVDYLDPGFQRMIEEGGGTIVFPLIPYSYDTIDFHMLSALPAPPSERHWLGTDDNGRDLMARLIYGFRLSVVFGLTLTIVASIIGIAAGAVQGYFGGLTDLIFQRVIEVWSSLPTLFILLILASLFVPGFFTLLGILLLFSWMALTGLVRAEFFRARNFEYVRAAKALGVTDRVIMFRHVLPNAMVATVTFLPFILNGSIVALTSLDFLGLGLPPGSPSLGELLQQGKNNLHAPWLGITAFMIIAVMLSLLIFIGEAVRDAFDPRKVLAQLSTGGSHA